MFAAIDVGLNAALGTPPNSLHCLHQNLEIKLDVLCVLNVLSFVTIVVCWLHEIFLDSRM